MRLARLFSRGLEPMNPRGWVLVEREVTTTSINCQRGPIPNRKWSVGRESRDGGRHRTQVCRRERREVLAGCGLGPSCTFGAVGVQWRLDGRDWTGRVEAMTIRPA